MKGSYIKIWIPVGAKVKNDANANFGPSSSVDSGYVNLTYKAAESELVSLGFAPIEERVDLLLKQNGITYISKTMGFPLNQGEENKSEEANVLIQIFVPELILEDILLGLQKCGVGVVNGTGLSLIPTVVNYFGEEDDQPDYSSPQTSTQHSVNSSKEYRIDKFYRSIKSRLIVAEVIKRIECGSEFSFDYVCLLIVAACLAFMGLVENSSVILVASMLVSPIMGPILAIVFGTCIKNKKLVKIGCYRELYSLAICIICGFIFGCVFVVKFNRTRNLLAVTPATWPTAEMASRTGWSCLVVGLAIAIPSGVGVAISVLGGNAGSMVGVAISASLLPPAVNTGLFWAMSMISYGFDDDSRYAEYLSHDNTCHNITVDGEVFKFEYACDIPLELFLRGTISFILTMVNIICIVLVGVLILLVKQVTPERIPQRNAAFWKKDIVLNREYEKSLQETNIADVIAGESLELGLSGTFLEALFEEAVKDKEVIDSRKWVDKNYPKDDLNKISEKTSSITSSPDIDSKFFKASGRFQILPALRSLRKANLPKNRDVSLIIEEEVKNAIEMQAKSRTIERRGSFQNPEVKNTMDVFKRSSLPRM